MQAALIEQPAPPMPRSIAFLPAPRGGLAELPPPDFVRFPFEPILVNSTSPTPKEIDELIHRVVQQYGHGMDQLNQATFDISPPLPPTHDERVGQLPGITVTVRRNRRRATYVARASATLAYGYGNTIGEAFRDCMDDFLYRQTLLYEVRDHLGPGLQAEFEELDRLHAGAR